MEKVTLKIDGMTCGHCVASVRKALENVPGSDVQEVTVGSASINFDASSTSLEQITSAVVDAGYEVSDTSVA